MMLELQTFVAEVEATTTTTTTTNVSALVVSIPEKKRHPGGRCARDIKFDTNDDVPSINVAASRTYCTARLVSACRRNSATLPELGVGNHKRTTDFLAFAQHIPRMHRKFCISHARHTTTRRMSDVRCAAHKPAGCCCSLRQSLGF